MKGWFGRMIRVSPRYAELAANPGEVDGRLARGAATAAALAEQVFARVTNATGLLPRA